MNPTTTTKETPMCDSQNRETAMVVLRRDETGKATVWCDPCIAPLVDALNTGDLATIASCCGHGRIPGTISLADGRQLVVLPDLEALNAFHESHGRTINDPIAEPAIDRSDLTTQLEEGGETYPFVEDENANITGYGHQDLAAFAAAVNRYDEALSGEPVHDDELWDEGHVAHQWVLVDPVYDEQLTVVPEGTPGAAPVTTLWGAR